MQEVIQHAVNNTQGLQITTQYEVACSHCTNLYYNQLMVPQVEILISFYFWIKNEDLKNVDI